MTVETYLPFGKPDYSEEEITEVSRVLRSGWVGMGPETKKFEDELSHSMTSANGVAPSVVTVNSCTSALFLSLKIEGVGQGDEVVVPSLTWCSTANVVLYTGAKVVFCDVDPETFSVTPDTILQKLTERTRAVIVVHYGGLAVDVAALRVVLPDHIAIVEDAAHALGSYYKDGSPVGSSDNLSCFSFYANKNLATAEGGAIALQNNEKAEKLKRLRLHGLKSDSWKRFTHAKTIFKSADVTEIGYKSNYTDLQAAIGRVQLRRQADFYETRLMIARYYCEHLTEVLPKFTWQAALKSSHHARHLFVVKCPDDMPISRDQLLISLREKNIGATLHYPPLHLMPLYQKESNHGSKLPVSEKLANTILTLPISASMSKVDAQNVILALHEIL